MTGTFASYLRLTTCVTPIQVTDDTFGTSFPPAQVTGTPFCPPPLGVHPKIEQRVSGAITGQSQGIKMPGQKVPTGPRPPPRDPDVPAVTGGVLHPANGAGGAGAGEAAAVRVPAGTGTESVVGDTRVSPTGKNTCHYGCRKPCPQCSGSSASHLRPAQFPTHPPAQPTRATWSARGSPKAPPLSPPRRCRHSGTTSARHVQLPQSPRMTSSGMTNRMMSAVWTRLE